MMPRSVLFVFFFLIAISVYSQSPSSPTITSFTPASTCQGYQVVISGTNFTGVTNVTLGNRPASNFVINNPTTITATVAEDAGSGSVIVDGINGGNISIQPSPKPSLKDISTLDGPFTNCNGNKNYTLKVENTSIVSGTGNNYEINWGDGTPAFTQTDWPSGAQLTHAFIAQGYFLLTIKITPPNSCVKTTTYQFYNGQNPLASITTTTSTTGLCAPAPVEFQIGNWFNNSPGTEYILDYGDGSPQAVLTHPLNTTNTVFKISHIYNRSSCPSADFTATLYTRNACYTTTYTLNQIVIRSKPVADFSVNGTFCLNDNVCVTNKSNTGTSGNSCSSNTDYEWDFGDGFKSTLRDPGCHKYAAAGNYKITLKATSVTCGTDTKSIDITVLPNSPVPTVTTPVVYCQGATATPLTATGTNLKWYTAGGTLLAGPPTPSTTSPGNTTYYVTQTLAGQCESPKASILVTVNPLPAKPGVITPVSLCQGATASPLTATGTGLKWYAADGTPLPGAPTPSTTAVGSTTYYVTQTTNNCDGPKAEIIVTIGTLPVAPTVNTPVNYCQGQAASPLAAGGTGLKWYNAGGTLLAGAPVPSTTSPGTTTYYVSQSNGCGESQKVAITVNVNPAPTAAISYSPATLCNAPGSAVVNVTQTGSTGGTYSAPTGLTINPTTGAITPATSTPGNYTIRYTVTGSGGCANVVATTNVSINGTPGATISYPAICSSDGVTAVTINGSTGGAFSSTAGLTINSTTGAITPATSTPGSYTVTYDIAAAPPCPGFQTTANITITKPPVAGISYTPATLCNTSTSAVVNVTRTGDAGGTYSITPSGLTINPNTGTLSPAGATPGTYTIRYTLPGGGGCANVVATTTVTVSSTPYATISYTGSPFCGNINTPQPVTQTGTPGGTYSAPAGLTINAATGAITPATSTPGNYIVTYDIAAAPPCPGFQTTTAVTIYESPVINFSIADQEVCSNQGATFIPTSTLPNTNYSWAISGTLPPNVTGASNGNFSGNLSLLYTNKGNNDVVITIRVIPYNPVQTTCAGAAFDLHLTVHPEVPAPATSDVSTCMGGGSVTLEATALPGHTIRWYDAQQTLIPAAPVIATTDSVRLQYYVNQRSNFGCEGPKVSVVAIVHPTLKITGADFTNPTACGIPSGTIVLQTRDLNDQIVPNVPVIVHYKKFQTALVASGFTDGDGKITLPLTAGSYTDFYAESTGGCTTAQLNDVFVLEDPDPPAKPVAGYNPPICSETPLTLTALSATSPQAGEIEYVWAGPAFGPYPDTVNNTVVTFPSASISDAGTYVVYATQHNCISAADSFIVVINRSPAKPVISTRTPLCVGDELYLSATSSIRDNSTLTYLWTGPGRGFPVNSSHAGIDKVVITDGGRYAITVTSNETGCSATTDTLIEIGNYPIIRFATDTLILPTGFKIVLDPAIQNATEPGILPMQNYTWTPADDLDCNDALCDKPILTVKNDACYAVKATNIYGCSDSDTICVHAFCKDAQVFVPNAFTPDGLPENRVLMVRASGIATVKSFRVFNRWGRVMYERSNFAPNSSEYGWNGYINGKKADTGVYVYTVEVVCENGTPYSLKGNVTLF